MTPEAQRIAIAEACGWQVHPKDKWVVIPPNSPHSVQPLHTLPDYLNDLNAMHEAVITRRGDLHEYCMELRRIVRCDTSERDAELFGDINYYHATAAQRAEAFLRTLNLWTEQP